MMVTFLCDHSSGPSHLGGKGKVVTLLIQWFYDEIGEMHRRNCAAAYFILRRSFQDSKIHNYRVRLLRC